MNEQENNSTFLEYKLGKAQHILYIIQKHGEDFWAEVHPTQNACIFMLMPRPNQLIILVKLKGVFH